MDDDLKPFRKWFQVVYWVMEAQLGHSSKQATTFGNSLRQRAYLSEHGTRWKDDHWPTWLKWQAAWSMPHTFWQEADIAAPPVAIESQGAAGLGRLALLTTVRLAGAMLGGRTVVLEGCSPALSVGGIKHEFVYSMCLLTSNIWI